MCGSSLTHKASESRFNKVKSTKGTALGFKDIALAVMNIGTWYIPMYAKYQGYGN